ncbi:MAG: helix-turn-helix domain-containing protein [Acutalibacteraceae bacterium]
MKGLGKNIRKYRLKKYMTQEQLAEIVDLSVSYIGMIERDEKVPKLETFVRIANALGCSADELLCDVIGSGYEVKISKYTEQIGKLPADEQQKIYSVIEALLKK